MILGVLNETNTQGETRVAIVPDVIAQLTQLGLSVHVVSKAGEKAGFPDSDYKEKKASLSTKASVLSKADILITFNPLSPADQAKLKTNAILISRYAPYDNPKKITSWAKKTNTGFSLDMMPRITVAQSSDVLSSLASIAGYKAVLLSSQYFSRYFPMLTTAAGSIPPAKILVVGAGVAGLQAVATARRLGAVVEVFDTRAAAKDEAQSLGASFVEVEGAQDNKAAGGYAVEQTAEYKKRQQEAIAASVSKTDIIITTAQLRGKPAPKIVTKKMVERMRGGGVIIDLASSTGGNCELTKDKKIVVHKGITIVGNSDLSAQVPTHASLMYSKNIVNFFKFMKNEKGVFSPLNIDHEVTKQTCIVYKGKVADAKSNK